MALCATSSNYDITEIATRILPKVVVLTMDPDSDVRSKAFQAIDQFLQMTKQHYEKTNIEATEDAGMGGSSIPGSASLLGWAMSSFTLKGKPSDHAPVASVNSSALTPTSSNASSVVDTPSTAPICVNSTPDFSEHHASTSTDDWGELENGIDEEPENDKGGWEDLEPLEETKPTPALTNIQAAQRRPVSQPVSQTYVTSLRPKTTPKLSKDEDDDLCGASAAPVPKTSKLLNLKSTAADAARAATAAPAPATRAKPLLAGRCRGSKPATPKLGAQRISRTSSGM